MATIKQVEWLEKLAKWKNVKLNLNEVRNMDNGALDKLFEDLKTFQDEKPEKTATKITQRHRDFNGQRFGLACKLVLNNCNFDLVLNDRETYIKRIMQYYDIMTEAEKAQHELVVVGEVDADLLLDERIDRELIDQKVM